MPGEAREILRLHRCPECDYDLRGLPAAHRCPECGFEYDETVFAVPGWRDPRARSLSGMRIGDSLLLLYVASGIYVALRWWSTVSPWTLYSGLFLLVVIGAITGYLRCLAGGPELQLVALRDSLVVHTIGATRDKGFRWTSFRKAVLTKRWTWRGTRWKLTLKRRWPAAAFKASVSFIIAGDRQTAAVVRDEMHRRIRATNERD